MPLIARLFTMALLSAAGTMAATDSAMPEPILPEALTWAGPPDNPQLKGAWLVGSETEAGPYALRVSLLKGGRIAPHTHPDT